MASTSRYRSPKSKDNEMVDFSTLVWPPPELRPPPTPDDTDNVPCPTGDRPILGSSSGGNTAGYLSYPEGVTLGYKYSLPRPGQSSTPDQENNPFSRLAKDRAPHPRSPNGRQKPLNDPDLEGNLRRFGCKDFPAGYVPTPRPPSPSASSDSSGYIDHPEDPRGRTYIPRDLRSPSYSDYQPQRYRPSSTTPNPMPFFEPSVPFTNPYTLKQNDFLLPVMQNGKVISHCRVSGNSGLSPDGYIESGLPTPSPTEASASESFKPRGKRRSFSRSQRVRPSTLKSFTPSPITYKISRRTSDGYFDTEDDHPVAQEQWEFYCRAYEEINDMKPIHPTRMGYWNRRGDNLTVMGELVLAPRERAYPQDLARYPKYAFMNEIGRSVLPDRDEDRVAVWQTAHSRT